MFVTFSPVAVRLPAESCLGRELVMQGLVISQCFPLREYYLCVSTIHGHDLRCSHGSILPAQG
jgi:hypothetical protein